jgi:hypothetical protein
MVIIALIITAVSLMGADGCVTPASSDSTQQEQQEVLLKEATAETGMPAIKNFRERKLMKDILELRDQADLCTYVYLDNQMPKVTPGRTALGGKLTYIGTAIGYGLPYATQYTNPSKIVYNSNATVGAWQVLPQADPNDLFSPASAAGTWLMLKDPHGKDVKPLYCEPNVLVSPYKFDFD